MVCAAGGKTCQPDRLLTESNVTNSLDFEVKVWWSYCMMQKKYWNDVLKYSVHWQIILLTISIYFVWLPHGFVTIRPRSYKALTVGINQVFMFDVCDVFEGVGVNQVFVFSCVWCLFFILYEWRAKGSWFNTWFWSRSLWSLDLQTLHDATLILAGQNFGFHPCHARKLSPIMVIMFSFPPFPCYGCWKPCANC